MVDGTLILMRDHRLAAQRVRTTSTRRTCRWPSTRTPVWSSPQATPRPGNRNDTIVYRSSGIDTRSGRAVTADGGYRGNREVIMSYRTPRDGSELPEWKQDYNTRHRKARARVEHAHLYNIALAC
jgi:hypothetical protein